MRSHQINLYLTPGDQAELEAALRARCAFVAIASIAEAGNVRVLKSTTIEAMGEERLKICLAPPAALNAVHFNSLADGPNKTIDIVRSPVVEFVRCYFSNGTLRRGRMYAVTAFHGESGLVQKGESFTRWAAGLIAISRKCLKKDPHSFFYFGEEAMRLRRADVEFD